MMILILGWAGTIIYLLNHGYISLSTQWRPSIYYSGNLIAAVALVTTSLQHNSQQAVIINGFWALLSLALLCKLPVEKLPFNNRLFYLLLLCFVALIGYQSFYNTQQIMIILGWSSAFVFSGSYLLFSAGKMKQVHYLAFNAYAAVALLPQLWVDQNWPVFGLEVVWAIISLYGFVRRFDEVHLID